MSGDVIIGYDGRGRCAWAGTGDTALGRYHDEVWGARTYDEPGMFEALTLGVFEVGLSWSIVFGKRDAFREAFHNFNVVTVAAMTDQDIDRLVQNPAIIRNRAKIKATIDNARAMMSALPSLPALAKSYESSSKAAPRSIADIPSSTPQAQALARQLKAQGYRFVGPTSVYAFMQNVGMVNDHVRGCFLASPAGTRREVRSLSVRTGAGHPITGSDSGGGRSSRRWTRSASTATTLASSTSARRHRKLRDPARAACELNAQVRS